MNRILVGEKVCQPRPRVRSHQVESREALLAKSTQAQNYNPEIHSQANPSSRVAEKLRKAEREKWKLWRKCK